MNTFAMIRQNLVVNLIVWDGDRSIWQPELGCSVVEVLADQRVEIGYTFSNGSFHAPAPGAAAVAVRPDAPT